MKYHSHELIQKKRPDRFQLDTIVQKNLRLPSLKIKFS